MTLDRKQRIEKECLVIENDIDVSEDSNIFGINISESDASIVLLPVPWEGTASYHKGTMYAYNRILEASHYIDLYDLYFKKPYYSGIYMEMNPKVFNYNENDSLDKINQISQSLNNHVYEYCLNQLNKNKFIGLIGGEHSVPYGFIKALVEYRNKNQNKNQNQASNNDTSFSILHIDAHHDLRDSYEGFHYSHASIMYRIIEDFKEVNIVSVGIRDFCNKEYVYAKSNPRIDTFYDYDMYRKKIEGTSYLKIIKEIISKLKKDVYISFDIDGLDPSLCPNTGTPVPGGLSFNEVSCLIKELCEQKRVIGFDLSEVGVSKNLWDENIASRILYQLCSAISYSNKLYDLDK